MDSEHFREIPSLKKFFPIELWIAYLLRGGVLFSGALIALGFSLSFFKKGTESNLLEVLRSGAMAEKGPALNTVGGLLTHVLLVEPQAIICVGLCVLIALPVFRVVLAMGTFLLERDYLFVVLYVELF